MPSVANNRLSDSEDFFPCIPKINIKILSNRNLFSFQSKKISFFAIQV